MAVVYFKRYRMQIDLRNREIEPGEVPAAYRLHAWRRRLIPAHAEAKCNSFKNELDAHVFPSLAHPEGCLRLMREIESRSGFVPQATWLLTWIDPQTGRREHCGTVQGIHDQADLGSIQNIGIAAPHRGKGLGGLIIRHCLHGFQQVGVNFVGLEVTAVNLGAIRLYERIGFSTQRVVYKIVEVPTPKD